MDDARHYRLPWWTGFIDWFNVGHYGKDSEPSYLVPENQIASNEYSNTPKTKFCAHVVSNATERRLDAHKKLNAYKTVDGFGNCFDKETAAGLNAFHGINSPWEKQKLEFLKDYRFSFCFEHKNRAGYHSEKLFHAKVAGTVPIYWGNESVNNDFNQKCFINLIDYESIDEMVEDIKQIDQDEDRYQSYANEPLFVDNVIPARFRPEAVLGFFKDAVLSV
jgi:hypothetical protein